VTQGSVNDRPFVPGCRSASDQRAGHPARPPRPRRCAPTRLSPGTICREVVQPPRTAPRRRAAAKPTAHAGAHGDGDGDRPAGGWLTGERRDALLSGPAAAGRAAGAGGVRLPVPQPGRPPGLVTRRRGGPASHAGRCTLRVRFAVGWRSTRCRPADPCRRPLGAGAGPCRLYRGLFDHEVDRSAFFPFVAGRRRGLATCSYAGLGFVIGDTSGTWDMVDVCCRRRFSTM